MSQVESFQAQLTNKASLLCDSLTSEDTPGEQSYIFMCDDPMIPLAFDYIVEDPIIPSSLVNFGKYIGCSNHQLILQYHLLEDEDDEDESHEEEEGEQDQQKEEQDDKERLEEEHNNHNMTQKKDEEPKGMFTITCHDINSGQSAKTLTIMMERAITEHLLILLLRCEVVIYDDGMIPVA